VPTFDARASGRVIVQESATGAWVVLLDGTCLNDSRGRPMTWPNQYAAGYDALIAVRNDWHGPARRFQPSSPWTMRQGFLMRPLTGAFVAASGHALRFDDTPVAVIDEWRFLEEGWGVFVGSRQSHCLQTVGRLQVFRTANEARAAADGEVAHWVRTHDRKLAQEAELIRRGRR
jgi:hypothetical protein